MPLVEQLPPQRPAEKAVCVELSPLLARMPVKRSPIVVVSHWTHAWELSAVPKLPFHPTSWKRTAPAAHPHCSPHYRIDQRICAPAIP